MINESKYCSKGIKTKFNKSHLMTKKDHEDFENFSKRWICKKVYEEGEVKVNDHDYTTGKYRGSVHQRCYLNLSLDKKMLVGVYNLQNYHSHLSFKKSEK